MPMDADQRPSVRFWAVSEVTLVTLMLRAGELSLTEVTSGARRGTPAGRKKA